MVNLRAFILRVVHYIQCMMRNTWTLYPAASNWVGGGGHPVAQASAWVTSPCSYATTTRTTTAWLHCDSYCVPATCDTPRGFYHFYLALFNKNYILKTKSMPAQCQWHDVARWYDGTMPVAQASAWVTSPCSYATTTRTTTAWLHCDSYCVPATCDTPHGFYHFYLALFNKNYILKTKSMPAFVNGNNSWCLVLPPSVSPSALGLYHPWPCPKPVINMW